MKECVLTVKTLNIYVGTKMYRDKWVLKDQKGMLIYFTEPFG